MKTQKAKNTEKVVVNKWLSTHNQLSSLDKEKCRRQVIAF